MIKKAARGPSFFCPHGGMAYKMKKTGRLPGLFRAGFVGTKRENKKEKKSLQI